MTSEHPGHAGPGGDADDRTESLSSDENDPTGVRELLAALPDPGPMPQELVDRIEARLAVEQAHWLSERETEGTGRPPMTAVTGRADRVVSLASERSRRRPGRTLAIMGTAAAGLVAATVAISQFGGGMQFGDTAGLGAVSNPNRHSAGSDDAADEAGTEAGLADAEAPADTAESLAGDTQADSEAADEDGASLPALEGGASSLRDVVLLAGLGEVDEDSYASLIDQLELDGGSNTLSRSNLTVPQALSCWEGAAAEGLWHHYFSAPATMDETPVVVLLARGEDGSGRAWLMPGTCVDDPDARPLSVTPVAP